MKHTKLGLLAVAAVAAFTMGACSRAHLSKNYGQAYVSWFGAQRVTAKPASAEAKRIVESLDAQEAAMVSKTYRRTVSKGDDGSTGSRMLMIGQPRAGGEGYVPPPSVP